MSLRLEKHPDNTFIGRIERGFDFPGYHFSPNGLTAARETLKRFVSRATRLYEQEPGKPYDSSLLGLYVKLWLRWLWAGPRDLKINPKLPTRCDQIRFSPKAFSED